MFLKGKEVEDVKEAIEQHRDFEQIKKAYGLEESAIQTKTLLNCVIDTIAIKNL